MFRLKGDVDYIIHDSPILQGLIYTNDDYIPKKEFEEFTIKLYERYNHINILLKRNNTEHEFQQYGRNENLDESIQKDIETKELLDKYKIPYIEIEVDKNTVKNIMKLVFRYNN